MECIYNSGSQSNTVGVSSLVVLTGLSISVITVECGICIQFISSICDVNILFAGIIIGPVPKDVQVTDVSPAHILSLIHI